MKLSTQTANALLSGEVLKDHVVKGLQLRGNASGSKSWFFYHRVDGDQRKPKIGEYPSLTIEAARAAAKTWHERIASGEDPSKVRQERRHAPTVAELAASYLDELQTRVELNLFKARSLADYAWYVQRHIVPALGRMKAVDVKPTDVVELLNKVGRKTPVAANRLRATLSGMFGLAERMQYRPAGSNPTRGAPHFLELKRERFATREECVAMARELAAMREEHPAAVAALLVILYAGTRVTELVTAAKSQRLGAVLVLQRHKTERKGKPRRIYLPRQAVALIDSLRDDGSGLVFGAGLTRYVIFDVWRIAREKAGCTDLRVMDLRRTFGSAANSAGHALEQIGQVFGHEDPNTTRRYAHLFDDAARRMVQDTADELEQRMLPGPGE